MHIDHDLIQNLSPDRPLLEEWWSQLSKNVRSAPVLKLVLAFLSNGTTKTIAVKDLAQYFACDVSDLDFVKSDLRMFLTAESQQQGDLTILNNYSKEFVISQVGPLMMKLVSARSLKCSEPAVSPSLTKSKWCKSSAPLVALAVRDNLAVVGYGDGWVRVLDGELEWSWRAHQLPLTSINFTANGAQLLTTSWDERLCVWDVANGERKHCFHEHRRATQIALGNKKYVAVAGWGGQVIVWDSTNWQVLQKLNCGDSEVGHMCFSKVDELLVGTSDGRIQLWSLSNGQRNWQQQAHTAPISAITLLPEQEQYPYFLSTGLDRKVAIWDLETGRLVASSKTFGPSMQSGSWLGQRWIGLNSAQQLWEWSIKQESAGQIQIVGEWIHQQEASICFASDGKNGLIANGLGVLSRIN